MSFIVTLLLMNARYDKPFEQDKCGGCSACLPACPTGILLIHLILFKYY